MTDPGTGVQIRRYTSTPQRSTVRSGPWTERTRPVRGELRTNEVVVTHHLFYERSGDSIPKTLLDCSDTSTEADVEVSFGWTGSSVVEGEG